MRHLPLVATAAALVGLAAYPASAHDRVVLHSITEVYPPLPPGTYYPVAQGIFGERHAPVYVHVAPRTVEPVVRSYVEPPYGVVVHAPSARGLKDAPALYAPAMEYPYRGTLRPRYETDVVAQGCRRCIVVGSAEPIVVVHTFEPAPKPKRKPKPVKRAPKPVPEIDPLED
ncbi:MAG: hypothetical protein ACOYLQ_12140 [Hyphomicrobiaceae bacterium]